MFSFTQFDLSAPALALVSNDAERRFLTKRLAEAEAKGPVSINHKEHPSMWARASPPL